MSKYDGPQVTVTIERVTFLKSSINGNPRAKLSTDGGVFQTKDDASVAYGIEEWWGRTVVLSLTRNGRVWNVTQATV